MNRTPENFEKVARHSVTSLQKQQNEAMEKAIGMYKDFYEHRITEVNKGCTCQVYLRGVFKRTCSRCHMIKWLDIEIANLERKWV